MMQEKSKVQALDPTCGIWLGAKVTKVEEDHFVIKWTGYAQTARLTANMVRKPVLKRICKLSKEHWRRSDPKNLQRGDKVIHLKPNGDDRDSLQIDENDPWNCKVRVGDRFYLYEHLRENYIVDHATGQQSAKEINSQEKRTATLANEVTTQPAKDGSSSRPPLQEKTAQPAVMPINKQKKVTTQPAKDGSSSRPPLREKNVQPVVTPLNKKKKVSTPPAKDGPSSTSPLREKTVQASTNSNLRLQATDKQKRKGSQVKENNGAKKRKTVTKEVAKTLAVGEPWREQSSELTQQEVELLERTRLKDAENCPPDILMKYGMAALQEMDDPDDEIQPDEMPPPLPPLSPVTPPDVNTIDLRTVVELLQISFEEEQRKRRILEGKLRAVEDKLEQLVNRQDSTTPQRQCTAEHVELGILSEQPQIQPPQTPVTATTPGADGGNVLHQESLAQIFATILASPISSSSGTVLYYSLKPEVLRDLVLFSQSPQAMARELMRKLFTPYELATSNVRGVRKAALDPLRVETIRRTIFQHCNVPPHLHMMVWRDCIKSMDQANRNAKKLNYSTLF
ncbi:hypothetical protein HOLleu_02341 [Holothuria leucospilota]|uniref:BEN domain-containing protein n=1 Tax=Holothuria leucospilota TaxID=206669 RepID=A0A9Q1CR64_HOLLE|nr:hypothetical protein HOLleu_02341 [Holothuria leucospilota]